MPVLPHCAHLQLADGSNPTRPARMSEVRQGISDRERRRKAPGREEKAREILNLLAERYMCVERIT